jgi:hypothetical protein
MVKLASSPLSLDTESASDEKFNFLAGNIPRLRPEAPEDFQLFPNVDYRALADRNSGEEEAAKEMPSWLNNVKLKSFRAS